MSLLFPRPKFTGFGANSLLPALETPLARVVGKRSSSLRARLRRTCPRMPGVYGMIDLNDELIYVGKAKCLRARLLGYCRPRGRDPRATRIIREARAVVWEPAHSEFATLLRELELIRRWQPRHNVLGQPRRRRRVYICIGGKPAPYIYLSARPRGGGVQLFGPVPLSFKTREAVRRLNDHLGLRDCPHVQTMIFADDRKLFADPLAPGCIRYEIGTCLGPCAGLCSRSHYGERVRAARRFLAGDTALLQELQDAMDRAAQEQAFERAAALRDRHEILTWLGERLSVLRRSAVESFVYPVTGHDGSVHWHVVHRGSVRAVLPAPRTAAEHTAVRRYLRALYRCQALPGAPGLEEIDGILLVAAWFRRRPAERQRVYLPSDCLA